MLQSSSGGFLVALKNIHLHYRQASPMLAAHVGHLSPQDGRNEISRSLLNPASQRTAQPIAQFHIQNQVVHQKEHCYSPALIMIWGATRMVDVLEGLTQSDVQDCCAPLE